MGVVSPLKKEEVPEDYRDRIKFESFRLEDVPQVARAHKKYAVVDVLCDKCGKSKRTAVNDIRNWIRGGRKNFPGTHRECSYKRRIITDQGYVKIYMPEHPRNTGTYVPEHIVIMESLLERYLVSGETVHHINGDRQDNRIENLQLRQGNHGKGQKWQCADCGSQNIKAVNL